MLVLRKRVDNLKAIAFCKDFVLSDRPKYIFGRNAFVKSIAEKVDIDGFIDEFTSDTSFLNKPIQPIDEVPDDALVVVAVVLGKPLIAEHKVSKYQFEYLDYYSFYKYSNLELQNISSLIGVTDDLEQNFSKYQWIYGLLSDAESKNQFSNIINFKYSYDIDYMRGFESIEYRQYFEDFLNLKESGESFVDVGLYDGYTSEEFIKRCPDYDKVFCFEPEPTNIEIAKKRLESYKNIIFFDKGLADKQQQLRFSNSGSGSKVSESGETVIEVDRLDNLINEKVTFIKMDIEGEEGRAIQGALYTIKKYHPKLAISVYHKKDDFWKIPELILSIRSDYNIYLRHYTQGVDETVMFFIPKKIR